LSAFIIEFTGNLINFFIFFNRLYYPVSFIQLVEIKAPNPTSLD